MELKYSRMIRLRKISHSRANEHNSAISDRRQTRMDDPQQKLTSQIESFDGQTPVLLSPDCQFDQRTEETQKLVLNNVR
jgi:hypothetical protein